MCLRPAAEHPRRTAASIAVARHAWIHRSRLSDGGVERGGERRATSPHSVELRPEELRKKATSINAVSRNRRPVAALADLPILEYAEGRDFSIAIAWPDGFAR